MITKQKNILIEGKHQKPILMDVFYTKNNTPKPVVLFSHGYKGFKDWGAWDLVAESFAEKGFFFVKFNFSHNGGTVEQPIDFPDLEAFGANNYIKELDDLQSVIDWIMNKEHPYVSDINTSQISLIGHSRAGGIVTIKASEESKINNLITWASVSDYKSRFPQDENSLHHWEKENVIYVENGRTKQQMPHYFQFYTSFIKNEKRLTISRASRAIRIPHLIIHGTTDPTVAVSEAKAIHSWNPDSKLILLENVNHVFGAKHPWEQTVLPEDLKTVVEKTISFLL